MSQTGRNLKLTWDGTVIAGTRTRGFTVTNDHVDVTSDDDNGYRTLLATPGLRGIEATVGGVTKNQILLAEMMKANITGEPLTIDLPTTTGTIVGTFFVTSYEETGEHDGAAEFSATFMSSGIFTYTPGS